MGKDFLCFMLNNRLPVYLLLLLLISVFSCEKPVIPSENESKTDATGNLIVTVFQIEQVPFSSPSTRAELSSICNRLNFAVYDSLGKKIKQIDQKLGDSGFGRAAFNVGPGRYQVVVVAHSSAGNPTMTNPAKIQFTNADGYSDTFLHNSYVEVGDSAVSVPVNLTRIVSLCRFIITDTIPDNVAQMRFQYKGGSGAFDASTGFGSVKSTQTVFFTVEAGRDSTVYDLYTFLHDTEGTIHLQASAYDINNNVIRDSEFDVPLKRRLITKLSGPYFSGSSGSTSGMTIIVGIDAEWEGEQIINY